jgi:hypothetical protein
MRIEAHGSLDSFGDHHPGGEMQIHFCRPWICAATLISQPFASHRFGFETDLSARVLRK